MMLNQYSDNVNQILSYSKEEAIRLNNDYIGPEHLMLGILRDRDNLAAHLLVQKFLINPDILRHQIEKNVENTDIPIYSNDIALNSKSTAVLRLSILESRLTKSKESQPEHLLLAIMKHKDNIPAKILGDTGVTYMELYNSITQLSSQPKNSGVDFDEDEEEKAPTGSTAAGSTTQKQKTEKKHSSDHPAIDTYGFDLTRAAAEGKLDPVVGREKEIERIAQILSRRKKNNPVLIGEPGVGKSAIVEGLALRIAQRRVSRALFNKKIIALDMSTIVAGTKYRGQFEVGGQAVLGRQLGKPTPWLTERHGYDPTLYRVPSSTRR